MPSCSEKASGVVRLPGDTSEAYVPPPISDHEADRRRRAEREQIASRSWARDLSDAEIDVVIVYAATDQPTEAQERAMQRILSKIADRYRNSDIG